MAIKICASAGYVCQTKRSLFSSGHAIVSNLDFVVCRELEQTGHTFFSLHSKNPFMLQVDFLFSDRAGGNPHLPSPIKKKLETSKSFPHKFVKRLSRVVFALCRQTAG